MSSLKDTGLGRRFVVSSCALERFVWWTPNVLSSEMVLPYRTPLSYAPRGVTRAYKYKYTHLHISSQCHPGGADLGSEAREVDADVSARARPNINEF